MKCDYNKMLKDGATLKEIGERMIDHARMMGSEQDKEEENQDGPSQNAKATIALILKKKLRDED